MVHFYTFPTLPYLQFVQGENVSHHFPRHIHLSFSVGCVTRGARVLEIGGAPLIIPAGACFIIPPATPHACRLSAPHDYSTLSVQADMLRTIYAGLTGKAEPVPDFPVVRLDDPVLFAMLTACAAAAQQADDPLRLETLALNVLVYCLAHHARERYVAGPVANDHYAVEVARRDLEQHFDEPITLADLAQTAKISPFYLNHLFQQAVGIPPYEYLVKIRLKHAQTLLLAGETIIGAAYRTGFADQSHFTRFFKRHLGLTPGEFRRLHVV